MPHLNLTGAQLRLTNNTSEDIHPVWSPDSKRIAFESNREGIFKIYVMDADSQHQHPLLYYDGSFPVWSADGKHIAYLSYTLDTEIYVADIDTQQTHCVTCNTSAHVETGYPAHLTWSLDGKYFAFEASDMGTPYIYRVGTDGSHFDRLQSGSRPTWTADSQHILFYSRRDNRDAIYLVDGEGKNPEFIAEGFDPAWGSIGAVDTPTSTLSATATVIAPYSPNDGSGKFVFQLDRDGNFEIYAAREDGRQIVRLTHNGAMDTSPVWSPDGPQIAFESNRDQHSQIYVMQADGTQQHNVSNNRANDQSPAWSPDGQRIAFVSDRDHENGDIFIMHADGSMPVNITQNTLGHYVPTWSPDGQEIAFNSAHDGGPEVYVMQADGSSVRRLTYDVGLKMNEDWGPVWSPDGKRIAFHSCCTRGWQIYIINASDGYDSQCLTCAVGSGTGPVWSPDGKRIAFYSRGDGIYSVYLSGKGLRRMLYDPSSAKYRGFDWWAPHK